MDDLAIIILAAGKGTRMKSDIAKVLHPVAGKSMINHVITCASALTRDHIHVVVGHQAEQVKTEVLKSLPVCFAYQEQLLGTGDAVRAALPGIEDSIKSVLVLCGDVPLIRKRTVQDLVNAHIKVKSKLSVVAVKVDTPKGYGRIVIDPQGGLSAIREESDASEAEKHIDLVNSGIYCFDRNFLEAAIRLIENKNSQGEYYLTDLVEIAVSQNVKTLVQQIDEPDQVMGVNTPEELGRAEFLFGQIQNELS
ncbi:MAG: NTP transferase domain-containing protein [Desulfobacter sp.]|nr:NTP transferase domain-containing protein [Desulfobacter sp.]WDP86728.1 MAG: NTP transferase domain-containing protein [Desulfobacter sp.]